MRLVVEFWRTCYQAGTMTLNQVNKLKNMGRITTAEYDYILTPFTAEEISNMVERAQALSLEDT